MSGVGYEGRGMMDGPNRQEKYSPEEHDVDNARRKLDESRSYINGGPSDMEKISIFSQMSSLMDQISKAQALFRELEERLDGVLVPYYSSDTATGTAEKERSEMESVLLMQLSERITEVKELQRRIIQLTERVQL